jgi:hypothetical protein
MCNLRRFAQEGSRARSTECAVFYSVLATGYGLAGPGAQGAATRK